MKLPGGIGPIVRDAIRALKPYGAAPIIVVTLEAVGVGGMAAGAPPVWVIVLSALLFGAFFLAEERKAEWRRRQQDLDFEALERRDGAAVRRKLDRRLQRTKNKNQPTLFDGEESANANDS
jgi:hypothetical protein